MAVPDVTQTLDARPREASATSLWTVALVVLSVRAGTMLGLWPVVTTGEGGIDRGNVTALAVHAIGALAVVGFFLARSKAGSLIGLAYTGYSMIALGLGVDRPGLGVVIWGLGVLTMIGLAWALISGQFSGQFGRGSAGVRRHAVLAALVVVIAAAIMTGLVWARI